MQTHTLKPLPSGIIRLRFTLEGQIAAARSPLGSILDLARTGIVPSKSRGDIEPRLLKLAHLVYLTRALSPIEERVCRLRYTLPGRQYVQKRVRKACDVQQGDGEVILGPASEEHDGWVVTEGKRSAFASYEAVGKACGLKPNMVQWRIQTACAKVKEALEQEVKKKSKIASEMYDF